MIATCSTCWASVHQFVVDKHCPGTHAWKLIERLNRSTIYVAMLHAKLKNVALRVEMEV